MGYHLCHYIYLWRRAKGENNCGKAKLSCLPDGRRSLETIGEFYFLSDTFLSPLGLYPYLVRV